MSVNANDLLMGGGVKSAKFPDQQYGTTVAGPIVRSPEVRQQTNFDDGKPLFFDDGSPRMQIVVQVQTDQRDPADPDDDGIRAFYIKTKMQAAVRDAVKRSGAKGIDVGGVLAITYTGDEPPPPGKRGKPSKVYSATYTPPSAAVANGALMGTPAPAAQYAPPVQAPVSPAPAGAVIPGVDLSKLDPATLALIQQAQTQQAAPAPPF